MRLLASFIRVSAWERVSVGRRLLCTFARVAVLLILIISIGSFLYVRRLQLAAELWHWQHGNKTAIGNYDVPVPKHWLISDQDYTGLTIVNTAPNFPKDGKFHTTPVISVFPFRSFPVDAHRIDFWVSLERQRLAREHVKTVEENTVRLGNESMTCIGGQEFEEMLGDAQKTGVPEIGAVSLNCMSDRGLNILFVGEPSDVQPFYAFLSQIRNRN